MQKHWLFTVPSFPEVKFFIKDVISTELGLDFKFETEDPTKISILNDPQFKKETLLIVDAILKTAMELRDNNLEF